MNFRDPNRDSRRFGQFEQLECRTVLSAATVTQIADFEMIQPDAVSVSRPTVQTYAIATEAPPSDVQQAAVFHELQSGPAELTHAFWLDGVAHSNSYSQVVVLYTIPPAFMWESPHGRQTLSFESGQPSFPPPLAAKGPVVDSPPDNSIQPARLLEITGNAVWFPNSVSIGSASPTKSFDQEEGAISTRDAAFQEYWSESLLLIANSTSDATELDDDENQESNLDEKDESFELVDESKLLSVSPSLNTLESELQAVDSVLGKLHAFKLPNRRMTDANITRQHDSRHTTSEESIILLQSATETARPQSADRSEGGMVLLEPEDNRPFAADDLTAVFADGMEHASQRPLGVEVSVGIYQEFEVGSAPTREVTTKERGEFSHGDKTRLVPSSEDSTST